MSTARPSLSDLLQRNKQYVATIHKPRPYFSELAAAGAPKPTTLLLTCADPRVAPEVYLQLDVGGKSCLNFESEEMCSQHLKNNSRGCALSCYP